MSKMIMKKEILEAINILQTERDILKALNEVNGWYSEINGEMVANNEIAKFHKHLKDEFLNISLSLLSDKDKENLESRFSHKTHFVQGVTKKVALEYYFISRDFNVSQEKGTINGGVGKVSKAMLNYYSALKSTVSSIKDGSVVLNIKYKEESKEAA